MTSAPSSTLHSPRGPPSTSQPVKLSPSNSGANCGAAGTTGGTSWARPGGPLNRRATTTATSTTPSAAAIRVNRRDPRDGLGAVERVVGASPATVSGQAAPAGRRVGATGDSGSANGARAAATSAGDANRSAGFFAIIRATTAQRAFGTSGSTSTRGRGESSRCRRNTSVVLGDANGCRPVSRKYRVPPRA